MNTWRVDRNDSDSVVPCGMNSILYIGDSEQEARGTYLDTAPGRDAWNQVNDTYGVTLSRWDFAKHDYVVVRSKFKRGLNQSPIHDPWGLSRLG